MKGYDIDFAVSYKIYMKSERWQSSKSILLSHQDFRDELKTERQWAKSGYLPLSEDCGKKLRPSCFSTGSVNSLPRYLLPEEVRATGSEELSEYFKPERERRAVNAAKRREKLQHEQEIAEQQQQELYQITSSLIRETIKLTHIIAESVPLNQESIGLIVIDTETTGLSASSDEIIQLSIVNEHGETLFNSYLRPLFHKEWKDAENINGISPKMVVDAPTVGEKAVEIQKILNSASVIVGYNTEFDLDFLESSGLIIPKIEIIDVMRGFAPVYGEWNDKYGDYKWQKLTTCAEYYGYDWNSTTAHNSLADCLATLYCHKCMINKNSIV